MMIVDSARRCVWWQSRQRRSRCRLPSSAHQPRRSPSLPRLANAQTKTVSDSSRLTRRTTSAQP
eukprot:3182372-Pyramimonas_sp.AAC.1